MSRNLCSHAFRSYIRIFRIPFCTAISPFTLNRKSTRAAPRQGKFYLYLTILPCNRLKKKWNPFKWHDIILFLIRQKRLPISTVWSSQSYGGKWKRNMFRTSSVCQVCKLKMAEKRIQIQFNCNNSESDLSYLPDGICNTSYWRNSQN